MKNIGQLFSVFLSFTLSNFRLSYVQDSLAGLGPSAVGKHRKRSYPPYFQSIWKISGKGFSLHARHNKVKHQIYFKKLKMHWTKKNAVSRLSAAWCVISRSQNQDKNCLNGTGFNFLKKLKSQYKTEWNGIVILLYLKFFRPQILLCDFFAYINPKNI